MKFMAKGLKWYRLEKKRISREEGEKVMYEREQMEKLKEEGKEKTATYHQYFGNRMLYKMILDKYREYGLLE